MEKACNASTSKVGRKQPRKTAYWWDENIAGLRSEAIRARRLWRNRGRNGRRPNVLNDRRGLQAEKERFEEGYQKSESEDLVGPHPYYRRGHMGPSLPYRNESPEVFVPWLYGVGRAGDFG